MKLVTFMISRVTLAWLQDFKPQRLSRATPLRQVNRRHFVHNQLRIAIGLIRQDDNSEAIIQISRYVRREALPPPAVPH
jgi:hypothetical protein